MFNKFRKIKSSKWWIFFLKTSEIASTPPSVFISIKPEKKFSIFFLSFPKKVFLFHFLPDKCVNSVFLYLYTKTLPKKIRNVLVSFASHWILINFFKIYFIFLICFYFILFFTLQGFLCEIIFQQLYFSWINIWCFSFLIYSTHIQICHSPNWVCFHVYISFLSKKEKEKIKRNNLWWMFSDYLIQLFQICFCRRMKKDRLSL